MACGYNNRHYVTLINSDLLAREWKITETIRLSGNHGYWSLKQMEKNIKAIHNCHNLIEVWLSLSFTPLSHMRNSISTCTSHVKIVFIKDNGTPKVINHLNAFFFQTNTILSTAAYTINWFVWAKSQWAVLNSIHFTRIQRWRQCKDLMVCSALITF